MTNEQKQVLIKDLLARLPYGVFVKENVERLDYEKVIYTYDYHPYIDNCKPYLRPMSSMTDIEQKKYRMYICEIESSGFNISKISEMIDWLNSIHVDYNGLIPMGLALPATEDTYNF